MLFKSCCNRFERTPSGSLRRRSWYSGHATNMCSSSSIIGSKKGRCLMSFKTGAHILHLRAKVPPCGSYLPVSIASGWELSLVKELLC